MLLVDFIALAQDIQAQFQLSALQNENPLLKQFFMSNNSLQRTIMHSTRSTNAMEIWSHTLMNPWFHYAEYLSEGNPPETLTIAHGIKESDNRSLNHPSAYNDGIVIHRKHSQSISPPEDKQPDDATVYGDDFEIPDDLKAQVEEIIKPMYAVLKLNGAEENDALYQADRTIQCQTWRQTHEATCPENSSTSNFRQ